MKPQFWGPESLFIVIMIRSSGVAIGPLYLFEIMSKNVLELHWYIGSWSVYLFKMIVRTDFCILIRNHNYLTYLGMK